ncbi:MAG TPA: methyltransferase domain-containing protein [Rhizomicrobium sp.]|jgi:malonyl-CoA O-methyltransferase|nr:methyltransferase domain-containing protein [Rhizomicrobium sp.]
MIVMEPRAAYRLWAPTYSEETAISHLDEELAAKLSPPPVGKRLLDAGCGTGRRLTTSSAVLALGIDLSFEMLSNGRERAVAVADLRELPFPAQAFDLVWCRLVLGHLQHPQPAYYELARVCRIGGYIFVSDFHADAATRGHSRSFRDRSGREWAVEHHIHDSDRHKSMALEAGLSQRAQQDGLIGASVKSFYEHAGREPAFERDRGLRVVAAFLFERTR